MQAVTASIVNGQAVLIAHKLGLFEFLTHNPKSIDEIASYLKISKRAAQVLVSSSCAFSLVQASSSGYELSQIGQFYLNSNSDFFYGPVFDLLIENAGIMNFSSINKAVESSRSIVDNGNDIFSDEDGTGNDKNFVAALNQKAKTSAFYWPKQIDLSSHTHIIDIGGGSGIHAIGACLTHIHLKATVCDRAPVLKYTKEYIEKYQLEKRIKIRKHDIFSSNSFPKGDIHFYGDIFHDWTPEQCSEFAKKSYSSLPAGGMILLHEMIFDANKAGPPLTSAYNLKMLLWTEGQQFSFDELASILTNAGFACIQQIKSIGNWSIVVGKKI